ncbi:MAG: phosphoribosyl-ATP diphosphatase [Ardenticatenaceae bacterium]|nr:phosphoribosyl-ATP diphosphatase [Anaerolineales bacterium]MCB9006935.1 phosphoribosyl-ATP diphosphatase [Ardenticatenaceae bacterium]
MSDFIDQLFATLQDRKANPTTGSYTASLLAQGEDEIVKKIGEEAVEIILAAKGQGNQRIVEETADLVYHLLVLLVSRDLTWDDIRAELKQRHQ